MKISDSAQQGAASPAFDVPKIDPHLDSLLPKDWSQADRMRAFASLRDGIERGDADDVVRATVRELGSFDSWAGAGIVNAALRYSSDARRAGQATREALRGVEGLGLDPWSTGRVTEAALLSGRDASAIGDVLAEAKDSAVRLGETRAAARFLRGTLLSSRSAGEVGRMGTSTLDALDAVGFAGVERKALVAHAAVLSDRDTRDAERVIRDLADLDAQGFDAGTSIAAALASDRQIHHLDDAVARAAEVLPATMSLQARTTALAALLVGPKPLHSGQAVLEDIVDRHEWRPMDEAKLVGEIARRVGGNDLADFVQRMEFDESIGAPPPR